MCFIANERKLPNQIRYIDLEYKAFTKLLDCLSYVMHDYTCVVKELLSYNSTEVLNVAKTY